ncbi:uncharacterized protein A4U43_C04F4230 [Asparagus officinalis]|uniref:Auxin efflux carrier family protein n=1 Tax=Asparagus officinalis TaxID=4686 RepID=A0A5P1EYV0_ASPOF|nr:protein PIN-LIKES 7-like [Asparagus officinalis]ONK71054.1 uncharacterized protein A4U43_C04F4230 [Asparagus officinalis]
MGLLDLLVVASMPTLQFLLVGLVGVFLASDYCNILTPDARRDTNKIIFYVFSPALIFTSLAKTVTLHDIISWWFMPVNIAFTFLIGTILGWAVVKILRPKSHIEGLVMASCSAGNLGNLMLIIIPAVCNEENNPFGDPNTCNSRALSYVSLSMALGGFYIWTHTYSIMKRMEINHLTVLKLTDTGSQQEPKLTNTESQQDALLCSSNNVVDEAQMIVPLLSSGKLTSSKVQCWGQMKEVLHQISKKLMAPSTIAAMIGFIVGVVPWLKSLMIGASAPLRVIQDSTALLGDGSVPCNTLILGGNLTKGLRKSTVKPSTVIGIIVARYVLLPIAGIGVVKAAGALGFLPQDPLFHYVLLIQFVLPPAMAIGIMAQLFDVGQEECSYIFLWTYLASAPVLTLWSTIFMYILS